MIQIKEARLFPDHLESEPRRGEDRAE